MSQNRDFSMTPPDRGLTAAQVESRCGQGLSNRVTAKAGKTEKQIMLEHCLTYFNLVFIILAVILAIAGSSIKNMTFMVIVVVNTVIGIVQQIRAKRAVDKLTLVTERKVKVLRDGVWQQVRSAQLVQDDIVEFAAGDQICADGVLVEGNLYVNESLLTGEADAVEKIVGNDLLSGSFVVAGRAKARLTKVGDSAFAARLAQEAKQDPKAAKSEMMKALDKLIKTVGIVLIPVGCVLFYQQYAVLSLGLQSASEATVAALVGMIPEGLYLLTSVAMAASALKLTKNRVLVQDMNCIESLARVDMLCVDKTGTITQPQMQVEYIEPLGGHSYEQVEAVLTAMFGSNEPENDTARALQELFAGKTDWQCVKRIAFDSRYKWSGCSFAGQGSFVIGAPETMLQQRYETLRETVEGWSSQGCRVLLAAQYDGELAMGKLQPELVKPLALAVLANPIRETAPETFRYFKEQGVTVKVISGDDPKTVSNVACRAGIHQAEKWIDASALQTPEDIFEAVKTYTVFGRVTPEQKKQMILALKKQGHTVAMTGDGVNDVTALKQADCSIAMASGAQAANQVARLVLTDSDFSAMPHIVAEGRRGINNIQRAAALFLVKNIFSMGMALSCIATGWAYPFQPFHLSIIAALTIGVPGFFLAMEPNYERVKGKFLPTVLRQALPGGLSDLLVVLLAHLTMLTFGLPLADSAAVCTAVLAVVGMLVLFKVSTPFDTFRKIVWGAMAVALVGCFVILKVPFDLTITDPRSYLILLCAVIAAPTVYIVAEWIFRLFDKLRKK